MKATLVMPEPLTAELRQVAAADLETAGVLLASVFQTLDGDLRVLGRHLRWVPEAAYRMRDHDQLEITSDGYIDTLAEAEALGAMAIWFHTHPGKAPRQNPVIMTPWSTNSCPTSSDYGVAKSSMERWLWPSRMVVFALPGISTTATAAFAFRASGR